MFLEHVRWKKDEKPFELTKYLRAPSWICRFRAQCPDLPQVDRCAMRPNHRSESNPNQPIALLEEG